MKFLLQNLKLANEKFAGQGALYFPCMPECQPKDVLDLKNAGPVLMAFYDQDVDRYVLQWLSRVRPGIANDWEDYDSFSALAQAVQEDITSFPDLHVSTEEGWVAADGSWW